MKAGHLLSIAVFATSTLAQTFASYTDTHGISFWQATLTTNVGSGSAEWGMALPAAAQTSYADEYIGRLVVPRAATGTWMGISHTSGMIGALILLTWVDGTNVKTSFRYATAYAEPGIYSGNATLSTIDSAVNSTHYSLTYRCDNCWVWDQSGISGSQVPATTASAAQLLGWAQATSAPLNPPQADTGLNQHAIDGIFAAAVASARNTAYTSWISLATSAPTTTTPTAPFPTATTTPSLNPKCSPNTTLTTQTWDYIIIGAGAAGIPLAALLAASPSSPSVLLLEKGPPSTARFGGTLKPAWLTNTNLTRFDVPGLDGEIWSNATGISCPDTPTMAGCILGGGTAINSGLWWRANPVDFDENFPQGWKGADMQSAVERVFERIPYTETPSTDGVIYLGQGYDVVAGALARSGWRNVTADAEPGAKNWTFSRPNHMFSRGERGGPMATYLVEASARSNFKLVMGTAVNRVVRSGGRVTGVEVEAFVDGGACGRIGVTAGTGRVVLSAGAFGTPKILFRSGIGPRDQLEVVKGVEGAKMVNSSQWIGLPVGYNLNDHVNTDLVITHPNVSYYDWDAAYDTPIEADKAKYLDSRTGPLAQSAPNLAAVFWNEIAGADGITRQLQWTARVQGSHNIASKKAMTLSQYLGRGSVSRGRITISAALNMVISQVPYLQNANDLAAVAAGIEMMKKALAADPSITMVVPPANQTTSDFLSSYPLTAGSRSANHWIGTCKMGLDSALQNNGSAVVDTNTKVYGTDNLFVVDASIFPGMVTTNPSALIVSVAEHASEKILALNTTGRGSSGRKK